MHVGLIRIAAYMQLQTTRKSGNANTVLLLQTNSNVHQYIMTKPSRIYERTVVYDKYKLEN